MTRTEIKIVGNGGHGVITLGELITTTAIMYMNHLTAAQSESYGAAARGGACWTEVILDDENKEIDYPRSIPGNLDVAVFFTNAAVEDYIGEVKTKNGIIIYDPERVDEFESEDSQIIYSVPAQEMARDINPLTANVVIFGAFCAITNILEKDAALNGVKNFAPSKNTLENVLAFNAGYEFVKKMGHLLCPYVVKEKEVIRT